MTIRKKLKSKVKQDPYLKGIAKKLKAEGIHDDMPAEFAPPTFELRRKELMEVIVNAVLQYVASTRGAHFLGANAKVMAKWDGSCFLVIGKEDSFVMPLVKAGFRDYAVQEFKTIPLPPNQYQSITAMDEHQAKALAELLTGKPMTVLGILPYTTSKCLTPDQCGFCSGNAECVGRSSCPGKYACSN